MPKQYFKDRAELDSLFAEVDQEVSPPEPRVKTPATSNANKIPWGSAEELGDFFSAIDQDPESFVVAPEKQLEQNPLVSTGKSVWNILSFQLPSGGASALATKPVYDVFSQVATPSGRDISLPPGVVDEFGQIPDDIKDRSRKKLLSWAAERQQKGAEFSQDLIQNLDQIDSPLDAINWASSAFGQGIAQIPVSVLTGGMSSVGQEVGSIYLASIQKIAEERNISIEEVIDRGLDNSAVALTFGTAAGLMDRIGAGSVLQLFGKKALEKEVRSRARRIIVDGVVTEGITEGAQQYIEDFAASLGAGQSFEKSLKSVKPGDVLEAMAQGAVAGGGISATMSAFEKPGEKKDTTRDQERPDLAKPTEQPTQIDESTSEETFDIEKESAIAEQQSPVAENEEVELTEEQRLAVEALFAADPEVAAEIDSKASKKPDDSLVEEGPEKPTALTEQTEAPIKEDRPINKEEPTSIGVVKADEKRVVSKELFTEEAKQSLSARGIDDKQINASLELADTRAKAWARITGKNPDDWYKSRLAGIGANRQGNVSKNTLLLEVPEKQSTPTAKGSVQFLSDERAYIHLFESADVSTFMHEMSHIFRRDLYRSFDEALPAFKQQIDADIAAAESWAGVKAGRWTRKAEERFARGFERYLSTGKAPRPELKHLFDQIKRWLLDVYKKIRGSSIDVKLSKEIREVFDNLLGGKGVQLPDGIEGVDPLDDVVKGKIRLRGKEDYVKNEKGRRVLRDETRQLIDKFGRTVFKASGDFRTLDEIATDMGVSEDQLVQNLMNYEKPAERRARIQQEAQEQEDNAVASLASEQSAQEKVEINDDGDLVVNGKVLFQEEDLKKQTDTPEFKKWFGDSKVVDENGDPMVVYRGDFDVSGIESFKIQELDRGVLSDTSGGIYFTDNPEIASNYANKPFTDASYDDPKFFSYTYKGKIRNLSQPTFIDKETKEKIRNELKENDIPEYRIDQDIKEARGDVVLGAYKSLVETGIIYPADDFQDFLKKIFGTANYEDPQFGKKGVTPVFLSIKKPWNVTDPKQEDLNKIVAAFKDYDPTVESIKNKETVTFITPETLKMLKELGYDGFLDKTGGTISDGEKHTVYIAFEPTQIKSAIGNRGTFDPDNPNILFQEDETDDLFESNKKVTPVTKKVTNVTKKKEQSRLNLGDQAQVPPGKIKTEPFDKKGTLFEDQVDQGDQLDLLFQPLERNVSNMQLQGDFKFSDSRIEQEYQAAHGLQQSPFMEKLREGVERFWKNVSRGQFAELPRGKYGDLRFKLTRLAKAKGIASDKTIEAMRVLTKNFDKKSYQVFERYVLLRDLQEETRSGNPLPGFWTGKSVDRELARMEKYLENNNEVKSAINFRKHIWKLLVDKYTEAMGKIGLDVESKFSRQEYFRHQVLEHAMNPRVYGTGKKLKSPAGRSFLKARKGKAIINEETGQHQSINTNYLQAEFEVMAQMIYDIDVSQVIKMVDNDYNIAEKLRTEAKKASKETGEPVNWQDLIPNTHTYWQPREGNVFYFSSSIPEGKAMLLLEGQLESMEINREDIRKVLAVGGPRRRFVIPNEVAEQLNALVRDKPSHKGLIAWKNLLTKWKAWQLISPRRYFKYNARNITGDADAAFAGNPKVFKKIPQAIKDLGDVFWRDKRLEGNLKDWLDRGGMASILQSQEMGEINKLKQFEKLVDKSASFAGKLNVMKHWFSLARTTTDFREALLRYAAYIQYLDEIKRAGKVINYGASISQEIDQIKDKKDKAFQLSNDLLGAYDDISIIGQELRERWIPFWSWKEVNFKRYVRFMKNAADSGILTQAIGRKLVGTLARSPLIAAKIGSFVLKATAFSIMLQVWNRTFFDDEEDDLPVGIRRRPHIIFGRDEDGKVIYFDRLGALGDFLEWLGLGDTPYMVMDYLNGRKSLKEIAVDMAKSPVNVMVQGLRPELKIPAELASGKSYFPDLFKPRSIRDNTLHVIRGLGLGHEYRKIAGLPSKPYMESLSQLFIYDMDPGQGAMIDIYDEKQRFLKEIGEFSTFGGTYSPRSNALYNYKLALRYKDRTAAEKYLSEYMKLGGTDKGLKQSLKWLHPLAGMNEEKRTQFEEKFLDAEGKRKLKLALEFYEKIIAQGDLELTGQN